MRAVLGLLFNHPERAFYLREIARASGTTPSSLQRELAALSAAGLITREARGNQVHFRANPRSPLFEELRAIVVKTFGVADVVREVLVPLGKAVEAAFIYGSLARGDAGPESDVDLMIVGTAAFADLAERLQPVEAALQRSVNPTIYPRVEFAQKAAARTGFLASVLDEPKIFLIGSEPELRDLAEGRAPEAAQTGAGGNRKPRRARR